MRMKNNIITALVLTFFMWCIPTLTLAKDEGGAVKLFTCDEAGYCEIIGYTDTNNDWITLMMTDIPRSELSSTDFGSHIIYINQWDNAIGNNGAFYLKFAINPKWSESEYYLAVNVGGDLGEYSGTLGEVKTSLEIVPDNCLKVGNDIYSLSSAKYTPDNVSGSLATGGNDLYYKIGGLWFNVLDEEATSSAYFTLNNAVGADIWQAWNIEHYYYDYTSLFATLGG